MTTWAVLASGPSMGSHVADAVRGRCPVVAVSDAWRLAPWADALVSADRAWWDAHPDARAWPGAKYGALPGVQPIAGVQGVRAPMGTNSGLLGLRVAVMLGATRVLLCGLDLHTPGMHFFGRHPRPLKSTSAERMAVFHRQFARYHPAGVDIVNCTPGSALRAYPAGCLSEQLATQKDDIACR